MRFPLALAVVALLAGCSTVSNVRDVWHWDPTAPQERTRIAIEPPVSLTDRLADLQLKRHAIRSRISAEPDLRVRLRLYQDLHSVGQQLSPLERQTAAAPAR